MSKLRHRIWKGHTSKSTTIRTIHYVSLIFDCTPLQRGVKSSNNRYFGGMHLLIRKTICKGVKIFNTDDPDILGITLKKDFSNL